MSLHWPVHAKELPALEHAPDPTGIMRGHGPHCASCWGGTESSLDVSVKSSAHRLVKIAGQPDGFVEHLWSRAGPRLRPRGSQWKLRRKRVM
jgi:hypothetical protein